jgi:hypothetical protein
MPENITPEMRTKWDERLQFLSRHANKLTDWEAGFVRSLSAFRARGADLSFRQSITLGKIFHRVEDVVG